MVSLPKQWIRSACGSRLFELGVRLLEGVPDGRKNLLRVLTYHRVGEESESRHLDPSLISAAPNQFERQMHLLAEEYRPVSLEDVIQAVDGRGPLPPRAVLVTFDDAYHDFATNAWPILRRLSIPVVLFVPTGFPGSQTRSFWWDRLYSAVVQSPSRASLETPFGSLSLETDDQRERSFRLLKQRLKSLPDEQMRETLDGICFQIDTSAPRSAVLSWDALRRLARQGVTLAPHTHSHRLLDRIPLHEAAEEIRRSRDELQEQVGEVPPAFAYPAGHFNAQIIELVRDEGFRLAFTTVRGINHVGSIDPFRLRRSNVARHSPEALLRAQLVASASLANRRVPRFFPNAQPAK